MDRKYIENEHIVERYLSGDLTVREARDFEKYCLEHPAVLNDMPIPVRLKARLARQPVADSETGVFQTIPSSAAKVAIEENDDGFDPEEERIQRVRYAPAANRTLLIGLIFALLAALAGVVAFSMKASSLTKQMHEMRNDLQATQMQPPGSVQTYRVQPSRGKPSQPTLALGWLVPAQLLELRIDATEGKYAQFQITIDKSDGSRVMQIRRVARDSNKEVRLAVNSSAFGPGDYFVRIDGYNWRGQIEEYGWLLLSMHN
jgi:hypothetical protein